ncbi:MAG: toxin-antitoxin system YwqK family antitoxin [Bacteroidetes bacterium]|nr:MAG: toxin-antitoxin system YwqK family antitoxin [Bacteroidota bacterium]
MMKRSISYLFFFVALLLTCEEALSQDYQIYNGDTINKKDATGKKQGHWIYFGNMTNLPDYAPDQIVEEGDFVNNRKTGIWKKYFPNGNLKSEITYVNGRPNGPYKIYYENGQLQEEGTWKNNRNVGTFKRYYENGNLQQEFNFTASGKREGMQKYYHENGQVMIEGHWADGKENGEIKEYYANGEIKAIKYFNGGSIDPAKTKTFEPKEPIKEQPVVEEPKEVKVAVVEKTETTRSVTFFDGNGFHTLYNKNRQVSKVGEFKNGRLWNGKWYRYNKDGILENIEIYKNGRYVGDGVIEDEQK